MTMKGWDIRNLTPKRRQMLNVYKAQLASTMAGKLGLSLDQVVITIKAGSIIVIVDVDDANMPVDVPDLGNGEDVLQQLKDTPGAADLLEEGKSLEDAFVDPLPVINDEASATADPHLVTVSG